MILRRFTKHITEQNWFAVGLDVIVVITGIFLGMQVNNWNEVRKDRIEGIQYLELIKSDLKQDIELLNFSYLLADKRISQVQFLEKVALSSQLAETNPNKTILYLVSASWESYLELGPRTYSEMSSSGKTALIRDINLRKLIADYYRDLNRWAKILDTNQARREYINAIAGLLPSDILMAIEKNKDNFITENILTMDDALMVAENFSNNRDAVKWLPQMLHYHVLVKKVITKHQTTNKDLIAAIDIELERERQ